MIKVIYEMQPCVKCGRDTFQRKNANRVNWIMHIILIVVTGGLWLLPFFYVMVLHPLFMGWTKMRNNWSCTECNHSKGIDHVS